MKMTLFPVITDPDEFARGRIDNFCISLLEEKTTMRKWINLPPVEVDFSSVDMAEITKTAVKDIDRKIKETADAFHKVMNNLEADKSKLLALPSAKETDND